MAAAEVSSGRNVRMGFLTAIGLRVALLWFLYVAVVTSAGAWSNLRFALTGVVADGLVVREVEELATEAVAAPASESKTAGKGAAALQMVPAHRLYRAIVEFTDAGRTYPVSAQTVGASHVYALGSKVEVIYPRNRPQQAKLKPELPNFLTQAGYLLLGTLLGAAALYWWWKLLRRRARINPLPGSRANVLGG